VWNQGEESTGGALLRLNKKVERGGLFRNQRTVPIGEGKRLNQTVDCAYQLYELNLFI